VQPPDRAASVLADPSWACEAQVARNYILGVGGRPAPYIYV
jgi:hypothetical protein